MAADAQRPTRPETQVPAAILGAGAGPEGGREPRLHHVADRASGMLLLAMVVFSPWALGGWPAWSVWTMNVGGYGLWLLLGVQVVVRRLSGYRPPRWPGEKSRWPGRLLAALTAVLLLWPLVSAINARAVVDLDALRGVERPSFLPWLPHSYDAPSSWFHFWTCLGLAGVFWGARDWLTQLTTRDRGRLRRDGGWPGPDGRGRGAGSGHATHTLPVRLERLLWVCCLNGAAVALVGIINSLDPPARVLWLAEHPTRQSGFFGPFWYRNNGAQYLNLLWPVCLGLWHAFYLRAADSGRLLHRLTTSPVLLLLPGLALMMAAPFVATSRGGSLIAGVVMLACLPVLVASAWKHGWRALIPLLLPPAGLGLGLAVAWEPLSNRFFREGRVFGTGAVEGLDAFTLRCKFAVPEPFGRRPVNIAALSRSSQTLGDSPNTVLLRLLGDGIVSLRFGERERESHLEWLGTNQVLADPGRRVEIVLTHSHTNPAVYVDGAPLNLVGRVGRAGFTWPARFAGQHLWVARGEGNPVIRRHIETVTLLDRALTAEEVAAISRAAADSPPPRSWWSPADAWERLEPEPLLSVRLNHVSPFLWAATGFGGRTRYYEDTRQMLPRFPAWGGAGPGTFASLYKVHLGDLQATDEWYVHDDYLETRFTYGWLGAGLVYLALALAVLPVFSRGGLRLPWYLGACLLLGLGGCLVHAKVDFVFQTHPILFLAVLLGSVLSVSTLQPGRS